MATGSSVFGMQMCFVKSYLRTTLFSFPDKLASHFAHIMWPGKHPRPCPCLGKLSGSFQTRYINDVRSVETAGAFGLMGITSTTSSGKKLLPTCSFGRFHQRRRTSWNLVIFGNPYLQNTATFASFPTILILPSVWPNVSLTK